MNVLQLKLDDCCSCWGFVPCRLADLGCWHSWKRRHVLQTVQMAYPDQASSPQGLCGVSRDPLVVNDLGTGSGWQQSKQNYALLAVVGQ